MPGRLRIGVGAVAILGFAWRAVLYARPLVSLDRRFIPDDTYYTLTIARSLAAGHGPTTDGHTLTSGFQPLLGFLLVPVARLVHDPDRLVRLDLALVLVADAITVVLLAYVAFRLAGGVAALLAATVWALSPVATSMALGGLETSLAISLEVGLLATWMWADDRPGARRTMILGVVAGLAVLARIDALALVALLALVEIRFGAWRRLGGVTLGMLIMVAPWWVWCTWKLGTPIPTSGDAAHGLAHGAGLTTQLFADAAGAVVGGPFTWWRGLATDLTARPGRGLAVFVVVMTVLVVVGMLWLRTGTRPADPEPSSYRLAATLPLFAAILMVFYVWFGVRWYLSRYLAPVSVVATLLIAVGCARAFAAWRVRRPAGGSVVAGLVAVSVVAVAFVALVGEDLGQLGDGGLVPLRTIGATGYGALAKDALDVVPNGARLGAYQSGALGFYADGRVTVVNLDGVVNPGAPPVSDPAATARYLRRRHVSWLADWDTMLLGWVFFGRPSLRPEPSLRFVRHFVPEGVWQHTYSVIEIGDPPVGRTRTTVRS